jgi:hypothetical protein
MPCFAGTRDIELSEIQPIRRTPGHGSKPSNPQRTNYSLHAVLRSEPHPVFVQPVRELVVKRWQSFRRRFAGSLHAPLPGRVESEDYTSGSEAGESTCDGKVRRLRAQESGDIHNDSGESTPQFNSEISATSGLRSTSNKIVSPSPEILSTESNKGSPKLPLADPIVASVAQSYAEGLADLEEMPTFASSSATSCISPSPQAGNPSMPKLRSGLSTFISRKQQTRKRTKSGLSEMHTPDSLLNEELQAAIYTDEGDEGILSAAGREISFSESPAAKPGVEHVTSLPAVLREDTLPFTPTTTDFIDVLSSNSRRPRLARMSTSGTQVFRPSEEGVEVDGLPVGPGTEIWDYKERRRERTYL